MRKLDAHLWTVVLLLGAAVTSIPRTALGATIYFQTNLTSDGFLPAANFDPNLKNSWGISFSPTSPFWVADQAAGVATLYTGAGMPTGGPLVVTIPAGGGPPSGPTGTVFNSGASTSFLIPTATGSKVRSTFLFDTLSGTIQGWNPGSTGGSGSAVIAATKPGAVYTGLTIGTFGGADYLYAANNAGSVDVYDANFTNVSGTTFAGKFVDPSPVAGFSPFNVQNIGGQLYVEYAAVTPMGIPLPGGYVDVFDSGGNFVKRVATNGPLNAPWGVTQAPSSGFGSFSGDILIGNFFPGGTINVFDPTTNAFLGALTGPNGNPIANDFLWALDFGNGGPGFSSTTLYFTAGVNNQKDGLFGSIQVVPEPGALWLAAAGLLLILGARFRPRGTNPR
jgi:uncharacterized protein (TIGR03118 family)